MKKKTLDVNAKRDFNEPPSLNLEYFVAPSSRLNSSLGMFTLG